MKLISLIAAMLLSCASAHAADDSAHAGHNGASAKAALGVVSLDVYAESPSRLHLLTAERTSAGSAPRMSYTRSDDGGESWSKPVAVGEYQLTPDPVKRGNDAQIVASGDSVLAVWTTGAATKMGRGPLAASHSLNGGKTWSAATSPSDAKGIIDHAFTDLAADEMGNFHAVWLDARPSAATLTSPDMPGKGLRYARSADGGETWTKNKTLDTQCCECCWNDLLIQGGRVNVLYRDKDPRDMAIIRSADAGISWDATETVGAFNWDFTGCPHVGGALAQIGAEKKNLVAVVWTAKGGSAFGVFALTSTNAGNSWGSPVQLGGQQASRPDVAASGDRIVAVWDEYLDRPDLAGNTAFAAVSKDAGKTWSPPQQVSDGRGSISHPRVVAVTGGFRVFWTEQSSGKPVRWTSKRID